MWQHSLKVLASAGGAGAECAAGLPPRAARLLRDLGGLRGAGLLRPHDAQGRAGNGAKRGRGRDGLS